MLNRAGLTYEINLTSANGLPLGAEINPKFKKYLFLDTGLMLRVQALDMGGEESMEKFILTSSQVELVNKGAMAELIVGLEFIKNANPRMPENLFYRENLNRGTSAEINYIKSYDKEVLPIEIKSGVSGKMKSLIMFMKNKNLQRGIRTFLENFSRIEIHDAELSSQPYVIKIIPLYALCNYRKVLKSSLLSNVKPDMKLD